MFKVAPKQHDHGCIVKPEDIQIFLLIELFLAFIPIISE
jgi:hypothetical protein